MPSLEMLGRKWALGSDDLVLPGFVEAGLRSVWSVVAYCS